MKREKPVNWLALSEELARPLPMHPRKGRAPGKSRSYRSKRLEDRLNEVCPGAWSVKFRPWGESRIICELTIHDLTRSALAEIKDGLNPVTTAEAVAFKRACAKFGLGQQEEPTLSREKASSMHRQLARHGLTRDEHYRLASKALRREVKSLTTLTSDEANRVWQEARKKAEREQASMLKGFPKAA